MKANIFDRIADKVRWGYLTAFILLLGSYILSYNTTQHLLKQANRVNHTNKIINNLNVLQSTVKDGESAFRSYFILKDEKFPDTYESSISIIDSLFGELKQLTSDNPSQLKKLDTLNHLIKQKYFYIGTGLSAFKQHNYQVTDSIRILEDNGKQAMDEIRGLISRMQNEENQLMLKRSGRLSSFSDIMKIINIASLLVAILLTFYSIVLILKKTALKSKLILKLQYSESSLR